MTLIGSVAQCWTFPVKSLQGQFVPWIEIGTTGVAGDRARGLIDVDSGRLLSAKRISALLDAIGRDGSVELPDGTVVGWDAPDVDDVLSDWLGRRVHLASPEPDGTQSYEMTFDPPDDDAEYYEIPTPAGSFLDLAAVHLITTATLNGAAAEHPALDWDVRRFRPNLVLDVDGPVLVEQQWLGRRLAIGDQVVVDGFQPTVRCAMPLRAQPGLDRQPGLFRAMSELNDEFPNHLGLYASVAEPGRVTTGDPVVLLDA